MTSSNGDWLDLPYPWMEESLVQEIRDLFSQPSFSTQHKYQHKYRYIALPWMDTGIVRMLWAIRQSDVGVLWDETSIEYIDEMAVWTISPLSSDPKIQFSWDDDCDIVFIPQHLVFTPPSVSENLSKISPTAFVLHHEFLLTFPSGCECLFKSMNENSKNWEVSFHKGILNMRLRNSLTPVSSDPHRCFFLFAVLEMLLLSPAPMLSNTTNTTNTTENNILAFDVNLLWAQTMLIKECASLRLHRMLPWFHIEDKLDHFRKILGEYPPLTIPAPVVLPWLSLANEWTTQYYYSDTARIKKYGYSPIISFWADPLVYPYLQILKNSWAPLLRPNLLFYFSSLESLGFSSQSTIPLTPLLKRYDIIPRVRKTYKPHDDPSFRVFNPALYYDRDNDKEKLCYCIIRTSNYDLSTYRSRDAETNVVETRNFLVAWKPTSTPIVESLNLVEGYPVQTTDTKGIGFDLTKNGVVEEWEKSAGVVGMEEMRIFYKKNNWVYFLANACHVPGKQRIITVVWGRYHLESKVSHTVALDFGQKVEKNWMPWVVNIESRGTEKFWIIYSFQPFVVLSIDSLMFSAFQDGDISLPPRFRPSIVFNGSLDRLTHSDRFLTDPFKCPFRGSGCLVRVGENRYLGIVHQVQFTHKKERKYFHRFVRLEWNPTDIPKIHIEYTDPFVFRGSIFRIEYTLGLEYIPSSSSTNDIVISYSTMDEDAALWWGSLSTIEKMFSSSSNNDNKYSYSWEDKRELSLRSSLMDAMISLPVYLTEGWPEHTYWINREVDKKRREEFETRFCNNPIFSSSSVKFHRIEAVDGDNEEHRKRWPLSRFFLDFDSKTKKSSHMNDRTIALTLSHFKAIETAYNEYTKDKGDEDDNNKWFMVMEDDACLDYQHLWPCSFGDLMDYIDNGGDTSRQNIGLCSLARLFRLSEEKNYSPSSLWEPLRYYGTTLAYMVRYDAVPGMLSSFYKSYLGESTGPPTKSLFVSDYEVFKSLQDPYHGIMTTMPWITTTEGNKSTIHSNHETFQKKCKSDFYQTFLDYGDHGAQRIG